MVVPSTEPSMLRAQISTLSGIAQEVATAPDRLAEAAALQHLWRHMRDRGYTYRVEAVSIPGGFEVVNPPLAGFPEQVVVILYNGPQRIYSFSFMPQANDNLDILLAGN